MTTEPELAPLTLAFKPFELRFKALFIALIIGIGFIASAIVSEILILCKSLSGPVFAGECGKSFKKDILTANIKKCSEKNLSTMLKEANKNKKELDKQILY